MDLTATQQRLYNFILEAVTAGEVCPTNRAMAQRSGLVSASAVADTLGRLQRKGLISIKRYNRSRVVRLADGRQTAEPPAASPKGRWPHWREREAKLIQMAALGFRPQAPFGPNRENGPDRDQAFGGPNPLDVDRRLGAGHGAGDVVDDGAEFGEGAEDTWYSQLYNQQGHLRHIPPLVSRRPLPEAVWRPKTCQYIAGEPSHRDDGKCGAPVAPGKSYCPEHHALCVRPMAEDPTDGETGDRIDHAVETREATQVAARPDVARPGLARPGADTARGNKVSPVEGKKRPDRGGPRGIPFGLANGKPTVASAPATGAGLSKGGGEIAWPRSDLTRPDLTRPDRTRPDRVRSEGAPTLPHLAVGRPRLSHKAASLEKGAPWPASFGDGKTVVVPRTMGMAEDKNDYRHGPSKSAAGSPSPWSGAPPRGGGGTGRIKAR